MDRPVVRVVKTGDAFKLTLTAREVKGVADREFKLIWCVQDVNSEGTGSFSEAENYQEKHIGHFAVQSVRGFQHASVTWTPDDNGGDDRIIEIVAVEVGKMTSTTKLVTAARTHVRQVFDDEGNDFSILWVFLGDWPAGTPLPATVHDRRATAKPRPEPPTRPETLDVRLLRSPGVPTTDQALWSVIRNSANHLGYNAYETFMDGFSRRKGNGTDHHVRHALRLPFPDVDAYRQLKVATEVFMMVNCGVAETFDDPEFLAGETLRRGVPADDIAGEFRAFAGAEKPSMGDLPYIALIRKRLNLPSSAADGADDASREIEAKFRQPCFIELLWSYWMEEGLTVQTMNALMRRFQNIRAPGCIDPLANLHIDPLRPLSNLLWGYLQDEQHRLTVARRALEYGYEYGLELLGRAVPRLEGADNRRRFLEAFHRLLNLCTIFYAGDDDKTVDADGFPILNGLKEVHLLLVQGAHNQYGDLPWTARQEMLMQQWLLARPQFREFLPMRAMVDYPESWMAAVDSMKTIQGWNDTSVLHFRDLAVFGEQILLGIRFQRWPSVEDRDRAANWARYWRSEIQGYIHGYRAVTGVDLASVVDATPPAYLIQQRSPAAAQARGALTPIQVAYAAPGRQVGPGTVRPVAGVARRLKQE